MMMQGLTVAQAPRSTAFSWVVGVIVRPAGTFRALAKAQPWRTALVVATGLAVGSGLADRTTPTPALPFALDILPIIRALPWLRRWWVLIPLSTGLTLLNLIVFAAVVCGVAALLHTHTQLGKTASNPSYRSWLSVLAFATVPRAAQIPLTVFANRLGAPTGSALGIWLGDALVIWELALVVLAIREAQRGSWIRAIGTFVLSAWLFLLVAAFGALAIAAVTVTVALILLGNR